MLVFAEALRDRFHERIADYLRRRAPVALSGYSAGQLRERIAAACKRAEKYGFELESSYAAFVELTFTVSPLFDEHPSIQEILRESQLPPDVRMRFLGEDITSAEWEEARALGGSESAAPSGSRPAGDG